MIHIYHGDGKGKTTAAVGLTVRGAGAGLRVVFVQFMKGNNSSELKILETVPNIKILKVKKQYGFSWNMTDEQKKDIASEHNEILNEIIKLEQNKKVDLIVLDEIISAYNLRFLDTDLVKNILDYSEAEIVLTGRNPEKELIEKADYVTEMKLFKHPFEKGVEARKGIEF